MTSSLEQPSGGNSKDFLNFHPEPWGKKSTQFDLRIFFRWVGEKPPTREVSTKMRIRHWNIPIFNRKYIHLHSWWIFQPVMLVFGGVSTKLFFFFNHHGYVRRKLGALEVSLIDFKDRWIRPYRRRKGRNGRF